MGTIIMGSFLIALAIGFLIFDNTEAGKRFFAEDN